MTKQRITGRFRGNVLLSLWVWGVILAPGIAAPTPRAATDSFTLTATQANFAKYYSTYLANGYWSVASSLLGTSPTVAHMVGVMDYDADDV